MIERCYTRLAVPTFKLQNQSLFNVSTSRYWWIQTWFWRIQGRRLGAPNPRLNMTLVMFHSLENLVALDHQITWGSYQYFRAPKSSTAIFRITHEELQLQTPFQRYHQRYIQSESQERRINFRTMRENVFHCSFHFCKDSFYFQKFTQVYSF